MCATRFADRQRLTWPTVEAADDFVFFELDFKLLVCLLEEVDDGELEDPQAAKASPATRITDVAVNIRFRSLT
ncbi:hypothetical protein [Ferrimicrobium acidiphilum]|jgi:hypothetical protein|uniref:hypothetical protein n=1 Tax=Ferrimicrobium acidiphilum TaxID=121039 RepID=UPI000696067E|nr:hypothetical protein [Ferrimicrobium acidiphilum]MCL5052397.1 hypothetical protein [Gammaproteobacteria bacterium]